MSDSITNLLRAGSGTPGGEITILPRDIIKPDPNQDRDDWDDPATVEHVKSLAESMKLRLPNGKLYGVRRPIEVKPMGDDGLHEIISGESRWKAAGLAGIEQLPCIIKDGDEVETRLDSVTENALKKGLTLWQEACSIKRDRDEFGFSTEQIIVAHGLRNKTQLSKIMAVFNLPEQAQNLVKKGLVGDVNLVYELKKADDLQLAKIVKRVEKGNTVAQALKAVLPKESKKSKGPKEAEQPNSDSEAQHDHYDQVSESETDSVCQIALSLAQAKALAIFLDISPDQEPETLKASLIQKISSLVGE